jgi:hypothetical protein
MPREPRATRSAHVLCRCFGIRSEPSALNELNNEYNDGNHEQKMNHSAANVADKAKKPEHD